jgi:hypothetical protein
VLVSRGFRVTEAPPKRRRVSLTPYPPWPWRMILAAGGYPARRIRFIA